MVYPKTLCPGDRIAVRDNRQLYVARAFVGEITKNYVSLNWGLSPFNSKCDIILKTSPLWQLLELVE